MIYALFLLVLVLLAGCETDKVTSALESKPVITAMTPAVVERGQRNISGRIQGANFTQASAVDLGPGISITDTLVSGSTEIQVTFSVNANATSGPVTVSVATATGIGTSTNVLSIGTNQAPIAKFTFDPAQPGKGTIITFDASRSKDMDGNILRYEWTFEGGDTAEGKIVTHTFVSAGTFTVGLKVIDNNSAESLATAEVDVENHIPPVAHFNMSPQKGTVLTMFTLDGSSSTDDGQIVRYLWDLGDGIELEGQQITYQFSKSKKYKVKLTVWNDHDQADYVEKDLEIENIPPIAQFTVTQEAPEVGTSVQFNASSSADVDGRITRFMWDFGNGARDVGPIVSYTYALPGTYNASLTVIDADDHRAQVWKTITVQSPDDDPGGTVGFCNRNGWFDNPFVVVSVSGLTVTADRSFVNCPTLCGDLRRNGVGLNRFIGDLVAINERDLTFDPNDLPLSTRPVVGESMFLVWIRCGD